MTARRKIFKLQISKYLLIYFRSLSEVLIRLFHGLSDVVFPILFVASGCQLSPPPIEEYSLARAAIEAARSSQAQKYATGYWQKADESYRRARGLYQDRDYDKARDEFTRARQAAEKAENSARLQRQKTGDVL